MRIKLLKKLRAKAQDNLRIMVKAKKYYVIQEYKYDPVIMGSGWHECDQLPSYTRLEEAKAAIDEERRNYILREVACMRARKFPKIIKY